MAGVSSPASFFSLSFFRWFKGKRRCGGGTSRDGDVTYMVLMIKMQIFIGTGSSTAAHHQVPSIER